MFLTMKIHNCVRSLFHLKSFRMIILLQTSGLSFGLDQMAWFRK